MRANVNHRNAHLAVIHIAKKQLQLDEVIQPGRCECGRERSAYHEMLWSVARVHSSADLDDAGRRAVIEHLRARGFQDKKPRHPGRPHNADNVPMIRKIEALLADAKRPWSYADAMAEHMFHVDRVAFCDREQLRKIIAALRIDQQRRKRAPSS